ncbi:1-acyl-sn-glycerol-3-phosphate acyltransferase [Amnibacterium sp.]|uniref:lysophospholipid acyltransferase family protein n=1 Tax=Amnibacterium sp. TaxID=1872496 RepID=UPI00261157F4|nr:lysophospholipid acyltransferase family protein [Amnibacterium sp.]MCU1475257.1 1-acyl-sn-glycerol-3-phosphate acyltransferase [Amnibacterium sp.]
MADRPRQEKLRPSLWWILGAIAVPFVRGTSHLTIRARDKLPATGPFILTPNHNSNIDPLVIAVAVWRLGRAPRFMAKASLFAVPVIGALLRGVGQIPVERGGMQRGAIPIDAAKRIVAEGHCVIVYPEGSLTRDPALWPMRGKTGAARLALDLGIPVIPVAHWGTQGLMPIYSKRLRLSPRPHIDVLFGDPVDLTPWTGRATDPAALLAATAAIMTAVTALLEQLRGETAPADRWDPSKHGQTETGRF